MGCSEARSKLIRLQTHDLPQLKYKCELFLAGIMY